MVRSLRPAADRRKTSAGAAAGGRFGPAAAPYLRIPRMRSICLASSKTSSRCSRPARFSSVLSAAVPGVRVKLLEAFASGIPVVSTIIGAEGLGRVDGEFCALADDPAAFAAKAVQLLEDRALAEEMADRARKEVVENWDMQVITRRLVETYRDLIRGKRTAEPRVQQYEVLEHNTYL